MAITLGAEIALPLQFDRAITYTDVEKALTDAGLTEFTIHRNRRDHDSYDVHLSIRGTVNEYGQPGDMDAADTITKLGEALTALETAPAPEPEEEPQG